MFGSIIGDVIGSVYEWDRIKTTEFPLFSKKTNYTDDTVLTIATADVLLNNKSDYALPYREYALKYTGRGYGGRFKVWLDSKELAPPYNSFGNGSAMRVSPIGFFYESEEEVLDQAKKSAEVTHDHPEGIKGAQATALAIFFARKKKDKSFIKKEISERFGYDLNRTIDQIRPDYYFDETCQKTVPESIIAFLESTSFENAIRLAISLGGDSDTLACITGGIAEAYYGIAEETEMIKNTMDLLPIDFINIIINFYTKIKFE